MLPQLPQQCSPSSHSSHSSLSSSQAARSGHSFRTAAANRPHQQQQGDLGGKCSQAASNGHHFSPAQYCPVLTYPGHPPTTAAATTTTATATAAASVTTASITTNNNSHSFEVAALGTQVPNSSRLTSPQLQCPSNVSDQGGPHAPTWNPLSLNGTPAPKFNSSYENQGKCARWTPVARSPTPPYASLT